MAKFNSSFNFQLNTNFGNKKLDNNKMTAQEEYWLDRILRDHSNKIFIIFVLFLLLMIGVIIFGETNNESSIKINKKINLIQYQ